MAICYDRLFHLMIDKKISNAQLKEKAELLTKPSPKAPEIWYN